MNISWFSPLDAGTSEIARYSAQLLPTVACSVGVLEVGDGTAAPAPDWWRPVVAAVAEPGVAPLPVYHIGNNPQHLPIFQRSLAEPGLVVLHDLSLVDLARHLSHQLEQPDLWKDMMCRQYGDEVRSLVNRSERSVADYNEMVSSYPLFMPFVAGALGVIVHSRYAEEALRARLPPGTPLLKLNLPSPPPPPLDAPPSGGGPLRFVFCGHVGPNRRLVEFMDAWSRLSSPAGISLELFGNISNSSQLLEYARHFGLAEFIHLRGYVSDAELDEALQSSDFAINLRWPSMGEASASQLRYWSAGLPTLVSDVAWYGELPDDAVCKVSVEQEATDLLALLEAALARPAEFREVGRRGWQRLGRAHEAEYYARELVGLAQQLVDRRLAYRTLDRDLVALIAAMCDSDTDTRLFRNAIETAVATLAAPI
jgi:hypothetical protein